MLQDMDLIARKADKARIKGVVFEDLNGNGLRDTGEPPVKGMPVSDGLTLVTTPDDGRFEFQVLR
jgi:hypothetical protein